MVEVKYWRDVSDVVSLPLKPLSTSMFVLSDLTPGSVYWYEMTVTQNSSGAQIGDTVTGLLIIPVAVVVSIVLILLVLGIVVFLVFLFCCRAGLFVLALIVMIKLPRC